MTPRGCFIASVQCIAGMLIIYFGGLYLLNWIDKRERSEIDRKGTLTRAMVYDKRSNSKGDRIFYRYLYKGDEYYGHEEGNDLYRALHLGDSVTIN